MTTIIAAIALALTGIDTTDVLARTVAALRCLPVAAVASNNFLTIANFLRARGIEADTTTVGTAVVILFPSGFPDDAELELPDWACRAGAPMVMFGFSELDTIN